uniref:Ig-like domain-containing protein n=1 Tax=Amphiprion ocellaris TaxID=80972 RepID=A0A3Q1B5K6_AMPOC
MLELKSCCVLSVVHSVQVKIMFLLLIWMMIVSFQTDVLMSLEGESVTLSCNYSGSANNLYWYQQKSSSSPQFLIQEYSETTGRLSLRHDKQSKEFHLNISSAAVSDSAVYCCALQPTVTGNSKTLYKNLWSKDNRKLHNIH